PSPISFQRDYFEAEKPILKSLHSGKIPVRIVRPSWIYGHGSWFQAFFLNYMNKKRKVPMYGKGNNLMSFVHVRDCAAMMIRVAQYGEENAIFNLYTESAVTQKNFSHLLAENAKLSLKQVPLWWISLRFDRAVSEAFRFSLNLSTHHSRIWEQYTPYYPSIGLWIQKVLGANNKAD
ncbi:MAG: NAD-dependent epimerase/dehydratase family protein, partial [Bacteroidales bacterium]|nr:NAD-dependent epimerase/dehydratase family protein [Bacteroidales bacterium]